MSNAPGLKWRTRIGRKVPYWIPPAKDIKAGYAPKSLALDPGASPEILAARCAEQWADLLRWRSGKAPPVKHTIAWVVDQYLADPHSPYQALRPRSQRTYKSFCDIIRRDIGKVPLSPAVPIKGHDIRRWHAKWSMSEGGETKTPSRARHLIVQLRILASFAVEIGVPTAVEFRGLLKVMRFATVPAREVAPSRQQVTAIVAKALEMGLRSMAITTLAQFELTERRTHIIGAYEADQWRPGWIWSGISKDWIITYHQTKIGRVERVFDLVMTPALLAMIQDTPEDQRVGPVIICERTGKPWLERHYATVFRKVAKAAGVPDEIRSMDMRAGAATEAASIAGITQADLQAAGGWRDPATAARYQRDRSKRAQNVVALRQNARERS